MPGFEKTEDRNLRLKQRKGRQTKGKRKIYSIRQRKRIEYYTFTMKQNDYCYNPDNKHVEQPNLTLGNVDCIHRFPNNISLLVGTTIKSNNNNKNIASSLNYILLQS